MADNKLKLKAMNNYWSQLGLYAPNTGRIVTSAENYQVMKGQEPNPNRKFALYGKAKYRKLGA